MADERVDSERPQLAEGPVEHGHTGIASESLSEQKSVRLRYVRVDGRRKGPAPPSGCRRAPPRSARLYALTRRRAG